MNYNIISKDLVLEKTAGGLDFYKYVITEELKMVDDARFENIKNPFYNDKKPSLSIYKKADRWYFHDHGEPCFTGDVFNFAGFYYDLNSKTDFQKILVKIVEDLDIKVGDISAEDGTASNEYDEAKRCGFSHTPRGNDGGYKAALDYFKQYGITEYTLREYNVRAINSYSKKESGSSHIVKRNVVAQDRMQIGYVTMDFIKFYNPSPKSFWYVGTKPKDYIFGWMEILRRNTKFKQGRDILVITGGEKDVLTLSSLGYDAICFASETSSIPQYAIDEIFPSYNRVVVLYDIDETGEKRSKELCKRHNLINVTLPALLKEHGGKDVSDYIKCGFDAIELHTLINTTTLSNERTVVYDKCDDLNTDIDRNPLINKEVYENLPEFLKIACEPFEGNLRSKDVVLLSMLTGLSTCFPSIKGVHDGKDVGLNLFTFISAPAGSGKSDATWVVNLLSETAKQLITDYEQKYKVYEAELAKYERGIKKGENLKLPVKPASPRLFIPADSSSAMLTQQLHDNRDFGFVFETEADVLTQILKSEWGDFSTLVRKAFHHEKVVLARKSTGTFEIEKPHLSILLTGTPEQLKRMIKSIENGFFSRFLYYSFEPELVWRDMFSSSVSYTEHFRALSVEVNRWWNTIQRMNKNCIISFTEDQLKECNKFFSERQKILSAKFGRDINGNIVRMGLIHYRISMLLTAIRHIQANEEFPNKLYVSNVDFKVATQLVECLLQHLTTVYTTLNNKGVIVLKNDQQKLYKELPASFTRNEFNRIADNIGVNYHTAEKYLSELLDKELVERIRHGHFEKKIG